MVGHHSNYEAFKVLHEARTQQLRATAVAAARDRRARVGLLQRISQWMDSRTGLTTPEASAQSFFWN